GLTQALAGTELDAHQRDLVREVLTSAAKLDRLVDGLLDYNGAPQAIQAAPEAMPPPMAEPGFRVLLADDNPTNRKVVELMLSAMGGQVSTAVDGAQALEAWRAGAFDLVLMDLRMPVMDGLSAIRAIRDCEAAARLGRTPIVVLSANTSADDVAASGAAGADGHLGKPVKVEELVAALSRALN
ncbi:MAG TPA: response regulator, partial [Phenylobacterium sp.]|nr:response regulator [Phenylobacterium sp.]